MEMMPPPAIAASMASSSSEAVNPEDPVDVTVSLNKVNHLQRFSRTFRVWNKEFETGDNEEPLEHCKTNGKQGEWRICSRADRLTSEHIQSQLHFLLGVQSLRFGHTALAKQYLERALNTFDPAQSCPLELREMHETKVIQSTRPH